MKLRLVVEFDEDCERWFVYYPEIPGCATAGDSEDEAIANAKEALELWFEPSEIPLSHSARVLEVAIP